MQTEEEAAHDALYYLPVFETSDTHGYLADASGEDVKYLLAYISDKVQDVRDGDFSRAVLLDGGDIYQGNTMSNLLAGNSISAAYAMMGYDAVTIGNHEFDWLIENTVDSDGTMKDYDLKDTAGANTIPVVISNLYRNGEKVPFASDYVILQKTAVNHEGRELPVRIGVIGLAGEYGSSIMNEKFTGAGYKIILDFDQVNALAAELEESGRCDATIVLAHEDAADIADGLGEGTVVDLVLGGHAHLIISEVTDWGLPYMEPGCHGEAYASLQLAFSEAGGVWKDGWKDKTLRVGLSDYVATKDRPDNGLSNPFVAWTGTYRQIATDQIDNLGSIDVLSAEAEANDGYLFIDTAPHFINRPYSAVTSAD